ncbi:hypothetical protein I6F36_06395 [Bradyrhizobium sp. BRP19]|uniref:hypothetical protein n=1 Tax=Bradyrhizobium sp. BRP19 TaxID=2793823 RepID=UPI001CD708BA|nr:hypothetical protein [Bradyrhizobium sp. BRP19]MCA1546434.1 hypothetical protein [Bradyrhizobium sp. BRP19]
MLTYTFRSYGAIVESSHAELVRDVRCDLPKAATKLRKIRQQIQRDRENAAERAALMTKAEAKLAAAIAAAHDGQLPSGAEAATKTKGEERRTFREAMRRRIREVAAILKLSEEQIEWPLTLKHREIGRFCLEHGVQAEWLLEGRGRIFKDDPIEVGPNMTGAEFAEVVRTLPIADQQAIAVKLREFAERRQ